MHSYIYSPLSFVNCYILGNQYVTEYVGAGYETIAPPLPSRNGPQYETVEMYTNPLLSNIDKPGSNPEYTYVRADSEHTLAVTVQMRNKVSESSTGESSASGGNNFVSYYH